jgi:hypothetical protein
MVLTVMPHVADLHELLMGAKLTQDDASGKHSSDQNATDPTIGASLQQDAASWCALFSKAAAL